MARIRSIKPGFAGDSKVARLSLSARLTFILLWCEADDDGRMVASPKRLAGLLYPNDDNIGPKQVERWVGELEVEGMVSLYEVDGTRYLHIVKFGDHQKPQHPTPSTLPPPPNSGGTHETVTNSSGTVHESLTPVLVVDLGGVVEKESSPSDRERNSRVEGACAAIAERRLKRNGTTVKSPKAWLETTRRSLLAEVMAYFDRHPDASVDKAIVALDEGELPAEPLAEIRPPSVQPFGTTQPVYDLDENGNAIRVAQ